MRLALFPSLMLLAATAGCHRQAPPAPQASPVYAPSATPAAASPIALTTVNKGRSAPAAPFAGPDGATTTLAAFKGKPVLLNLWATWCVPCVREMPALEALAKREGDRLAVVTVSQDMQGRKIVDDYFKAHGFATLKPWLDKDNGLMLALREGALPVSVLYDADGKEVWRVQGDMDWSGAKAKALLAQAGV